MTAFAARTPRDHAPFGLQAISGTGLVAIWILLSLFAAGSAALLGPWALMLPIYALGLVMAVARPRVAAGSLLIIAIVLEPAAIDFTGPIADAFWAMPPGFENAFRITTSPIEVVTYVAAASALVRYPSQAKLPSIAWGIPAVIALGFAYGWYKGGQLNLGYNECRGLLSGMAVFILAVRVLPSDPKSLVKPIMVGETILAALVVTRYLYFVRGSRLNVPVEFAFSHEGSVILGVGLVLGGLVLIRENATLGQRLLAAAYCCLVLAAMIASGRRAATLILLVGGLTMGGLLFPRRPMLVTLTAIPILLAGTAYLAAYWNHEYGAVAQPARAIRSQFDPTLRDESSDEYRTIEKYNVIETIRLNRPFGVGFGQPFYQFQPLPYLGGFWSLQQYTPHQSILWLWLKMGILGISVVLGFTAVAMSRCMAVLRSGASSEHWMLAAVSFTVIVMFLMYSTVDLGFIGPRSVAPGVLACAIAFTLRPPKETAS